MAAERLAELLSKTVKVTFVAKFASGFANVTVELKSEGGRMKLWRLQIDGRKAPRRLATSAAASATPEAA